MWPLCTSLPCKTPNESQTVFLCARASSSCRTSDFQVSAPPSPASDCFSTSVLISDFFPFSKESINNVFIAKEKTEQLD